MITSFDTILSYIVFALSVLFNCSLVVLPLMVCVAYLTLAERKIIAFMQLRVGPSMAGPFGLLQPIADAIKLMTKEMIIPEVPNKLIFFLAPVITFILAMIGWAVIPISDTFWIADINLGALYLLAVSSIAVYGVILAGLASHSVYAIFGAVRSAAQMISYEIAMSCCVLAAILVYGSANLLEIIYAQQNTPIVLQILLWPICIIFFISMLAETNRHPFDLPEAEAELVAGYHVEYSSIGFALFFLGEYANMILMSGFVTILFLGGWLPPFNLSYLDFFHPFIWFALKVSLCLFIFIWVRASLPRYRYDQLIRIGWKFFIPFTLIWIYIIAVAKAYIYS